MPTAAAHPQVQTGVIDRFNEDCSPAGWDDLNPNNSTAYSFGFGTGTQKVTIRSTALVADGRGSGDAGIFGTYSGLNGTSQTFRAKATLRLGNVTNIKPNSFHGRLTIHFLGTDGKELVKECNARRYDTNTAFTTIETVCTAPLNARYVRVRVGANALPMGPGDADSDRAVAGYGTVFVDQYYLYYCGSAGASCPVN